MPDPQLRRIAFVTRHYADLRGGVIRAAVASLIIAAGLTADVVWRTSAFVLVFAVVVGVTSLLLGRWMDRRFGRVISGSDYQSRVLAIGVLLFALATRTDHLVRGTGPSLLFLSAAAFGLWLAIRLWPYGALNLLPSLVAAAVAIDFAGVDSAEALREWERRAYLLTLGAWTLAGLFDLGFLISAMPHRRTRSSEESEGEHVESI